MFFPSCLLLFWQVVTECRSVVLKMSSHCCLWLMCVFLLMVLALWFGASVLVKPECGLDVKVKLLAVMRLQWQPSCRTTHNSSPSPTPSPPTPLPSSPSPSPPTLLSCIPSPSTHTPSPPSPPTPLPLPSLIPPPLQPQHLPPSTPTPSCPTPPPSHHPPPPLHPSSSPPTPTPSPSL